MPDAFDEAVRYLLSLGHETLAMKLGLENTERLLEALGQPHRQFPKIQIAGTNGKGSTAVMLDQICRAAGIKTGLYTSPHLISITERIRISGHQITPAEFSRVAHHVRESVEALLAQQILLARPTFFEQVTAIALEAFREARVEVAILETGLGGRLDATTATRAEIAVITPIALDHQEHLGPTLREIAFEKAAIIRPDIQRAIIAPQEPEALDVIRKRCAECGVTPLIDACRVTIHGADAEGRVRATFETARGLYEKVCLGLRGQHQTVNAALAIQSAEALLETGFEIPREAIIEGLETATHAGRLELWNAQRPAMLFDGAHNEAGARALAEYLREYVRAPVTLVFGAMRDKDLNSIAALLFPRAARLILTTASNPRSATLETLGPLASAFLEAERITAIPDVAQALREAIDQTPPEGLICVTGSLYLIGEAQAILKTAPPAQD